MSAVQHHVDHVGSLIRPPKLYDAFQGHEAGAVSDEELHAVQDEEIRRIDEAAAYCDPSQLGLCPQCGFGSSQMSRYNLLENPMTPAIQEAKLRLIVETAAEIWG